MSERTPTLRVVMYPAKGESDVAEYSLGGLTTLDAADIKRAVEAFLLPELRRLQTSRQAANTGDNRGAMS